MPDTHADSVQRAAALIAAADALIVAAGAGMGVDSGLPDFRGPEGFWRAYPALREAGLRFEEIANPQHFADNPALAWGFYGHRLALYRNTTPHAGFHVLQDIAASLPEGAFVFTSNVDGQFQKAGFPATGIVEVHGSIHHLQCSAVCCDDIWSAAAFVPDVDENRCQLRNAPPRCPHCRAVARPNILMFGDGNWIADRSERQQWEFQQWRANVGGLVVIEIGAGTAIPSVRRFSEHQRCPIIRINNTDAHVRGTHDVGMPMAALAALNGIADCLARR